MFDRPDGREYNTNVNIVHVRGNRMAVKLENARESLMECGKDFLLQNRDGKAGKINVRDLTARCGMALGTFYHYFDSKDDLVRQIMNAYTIKPIDVRQLYITLRRFIP